MLGEIKDLATYGFVAGEHIDFSPFMYYDYLRHFTASIIELCQLIFCAAVNKEKDD